MTVAAARELAARLIAGEPEQVAAAHVLGRPLPDDRAEVSGPQGIVSLFAPAGAESLPVVSDTGASQRAGRAQGARRAPDLRRGQNVQRAHGAETGAVAGPYAGPRTVSNGTMTPSDARRPRLSRRRISGVGVPVGATGFAALLAIATVLPAQAIAGGPAVPAATSLVAVGGKAGDRGARGDIQAFVAGTDVPRTVLTGAEGFTAVSQAQVAAESGIRFSDSLYTNDRTAKIQWPYVVGVAMSSPFGMRDGVMHEGIDLVPGNGAPIQAIADGTVRLASESDGGYGVGVYIDHVIDGKLITSHYGHMQYGSLKVKTGDKVKVGDPVGRTGDTGHSFGPHLHFELIVDGTKIDPLPWMLAHAGRH